MWYVYVMLIVFLGCFVSASYKFVTDSMPFDGKYKADVGHFLFIILALFAVSVVWPVSTPVILVMYLRDFVQGRKKRKVG